MNLFDFELSPPIVVYLPENQDTFVLSEVLDDILTQGEIPIARVNKKSKQFKDCYQEFIIKGKKVQEIIYTINYSENYQA